MKELLLVSLLLTSTAAAAMAAEAAPTVVNIEVTERGYEPNLIEVKAGSEVSLKVTRKTDSTCATDIRVPSRKIEKDLPLNKTVWIALGRLDAGVFKFGCSMNMVTGKIVAK